ncbi:MAG: M12 family metallo-peptidase [Planctomycetota bacterium]
MGINRRRRDANRSGDKVRNLNTSRGRRRSNTRNTASLNLRFVYEQLEFRKVLAPLFPVYVGETLTLGNPDSAAAAPYPLAETFNLSTNPTASKTLYLDFNGHRSVDNDWGHDIVFPAFDRDGNPGAFSDAELIEIQLMFQNVAEDFAPFDLNITTKEPTLDALIRSSVTDPVFGMRVVQTQATDGFGDGIGGVAYLNSFGPNEDTPCFSFNQGVNNGAMTISHEAGHTFGLRHDGLSGQAYHPGVGSGPTGWGPIMGAPFGKNLVQWSRGEYVGADNTEDDFAVITQVRNGVNFKTDDFGDTFATAANLPVTGRTASTYGFITRSTDVDMFKFKAGTGLSTFNIRGFQGNPNLDVVARVYNSVGTLVATSNPLDDVNASFSVNLNNGTYYLAIDGTGKDGVYTDYGSVGFYTLDADIPRPATVLGESGVIVGLTSTWRKINLPNSFDNPVVVMGTPTRLGGEPITVRVRNVTPNSFEARIDEWEYLDGVHGREDVSFLVLEAGSYTLPDGTLIKAGKSQVNHRWSAVNFSGAGAYTSAPIVLSQVVSTNENVAVTTRHRSVGTSGFEVRVQEEEAADRIHALETVSWVAIELGTGSYNGLDFEAAVTPNAVTHLNYTVNFATNFPSRPGFFAQMQSHNGGDPATVRHNGLTNRSATIFLEEERSFDAEVAHNPEVVGWLAMETGSLVLPPGGMPPEKMVMAPGKNGLKFETAGELAAAAALQRSWKEDTKPFGSHEGKCCCPGCSGESVLDDGQSGAGDLASLILGLKMQAPTNSGKAATQPLQSPGLFGPLTLAGAQTRGVSDSVERDWSSSSSKSNRTENNLDSPLFSTPGTKLL